MAVVISKLFVIVLWKTVVEERTIDRDKSAVLDTNTDRERQNSLQAGKTRCQVATIPRILRVTVTIVEGCQP